MRKELINKIEVAMLASVDEALLNGSLKDVCVKRPERFSRYPSELPIMLEESPRTRREKWVNGMKLAKKRAAMDNHSRDVGYYRKNRITVKRDKTDKALWLNEDVIASRKKEEKAKDIFRTYIEREKDEERYWAYAADELFDEVTDSYIKKEIKGHYFDLPEDVIISFA